MSNVKLQASASGTGTVTIAPPVTNSDLTINLPANSGTVPTIASVVNNGVVYTNSTGAITSSSALTFDGTNYLNVTGLRIGGSDTTNTIYQATGALALSTGSTSSIIFNVNLSEGMRLTTTGLGIGTNSPVGKLDVRGASYVDTDYGYFRANNALQRLRIGTDGSNDIYLPGAAPLTISGQAGVAFSTALTERMRLDSSGNLGLGVTPSAWAGAAVNYNTFQFGVSSVTNVANVAAEFAYNQYIDSNGTRRYISTNTALRYRMGNTEHQWFTAPSGTAGNAISFTQAMTLDASGNLLVGSTSGSSRVDVTGSDRIIRVNSSTTGGNALIRYSDNGTAKFSSGWNPATGFIVYDDAAAAYRTVIDTSGNLIVADTSTQYSAKLYVNGSIAARNSGVDGSYETAFVAGFTSNYNERNIIQTAVSSVGTGSGFRFRASDGAGSAGTTAVLDLTRTQTIFYTGGSERARITSGGVLCVGASSFGAAVRAGFRGDSTSVATVEIQNESATGTMLTFRTNGESQVGSVSFTSGGVTYNTTSDSRLKTLIAPVTGSGARLDALNPIEYEWKANGKRARGFFAHEFQQVYADSVTGEKDAVDEEGKPVYQAMQASTSEVIADLVAEIQSLRARVAALESNP